MVGGRFVALTPVQFLAAVPTGTLEEEERIIANQWEKAIDSLITTGIVRQIDGRKTGTKVLNISYKLALKVDPGLPKASAGVRRELKRRYVQAGWLDLWGCTAQLQLIYYSETFK